jgi:hypothetical protein
MMAAEERWAHDVIHGAKARAEERMRVYDTAPRGCRDEAKEFGIVHQYENPGRYADMLQRRKAREERMLNEVLQR